MKIAAVPDAMISATPCSQLLPATQPRNVVSAPAKTMNPTSNPNPLSTRIAARTLHRWLASAVAICLVAGTFSAWGATKTWSGASGIDYNWGTAGNWVENAIPETADDVVLPSVTGSAINPQNNITGLSLHSVTFTGGGYTVAGNAVTITAGLTNSSGALNGFNLPMTLIGTQTFELTGNTTFGGTLDHISTLNVTCASGKVSELQNVISGAGSFVKRGAGTLKISGPVNTYTGKTTVLAGILFIDRETSLGANPSVWTPNQLTLNGGTLEINNNAEIGFANTQFGITLGASGGTIITDTGVTAQIDNQISGATSACSLTKGGPGQLTLKATVSAGNGAIYNTYLGATIIDQGTLVVDVENELGGDPSSFTAGQLTINGGTFNASDTFSISGNRGTTVGASGGTIYVIASKTLTMVNPVTGSGSGVLTKTGNGTLALPTANDYDGGTTLSQGILSINHANALGTGTFTISGGTIDNTSSGAITLAGVTTHAWNGDFTFKGTQNLNLGTGAVTVNGNRVVTTTTAGKTLTVGGAISESSGSRTLTKAGSGTMALYGVNTYSGKTSISAGVLQINTVKNVSAGTGSSLGQPTSTANGTIAIGSDLSAATLIYTGSGDTSDRVIDLAGTDTYGATIQNDGSGALHFTAAANTASGDASLGGNKTLTLQGSNTGENSISGTIVDAPDSETTSVTKSGDGKWVLSGTSTFTGSMAVQAGTLSVPTVNNSAANGPLGKSSSAVTLGSSSKTGTLQYTGGGTPTSSKPFTMATSGTGAFQIDSGTLTLTGLLNGSGALTKTGTGTLVFLTTTETYSGATTVSAGKLLVNSATASGSAVTVASTATLGGTGTVGGTVAANGILSPGTSPGTLNSGAETWNSGGSYDWDISNVSGAAGTQWDLLNITGTLTVAATSGSKFTIRVVSPVGGPTGFDNTQNYSWLIATASSGLGGTFAANKFTIDTSGFDALQGPGAFVISQSGNNVYLQFGHVTASAVTVGRAWGTYLRILKSDFLTANTSGGTGTRTVQSVTSRNSDFVDYSGDYILFAPAGNATRILDYTVVDSSSPTPYSASSTITVTVTNAVRTCDQINYSAGSVTLKFAGMPGFSYVVERSAAVEGTWAEVAGSATNLPSNVGVWTFTDSSPLSPNCYYRLRQKNTLE